MGSSLARQRAQNSNALGVNLDQLMDIMTGEDAGQESAIQLADDGSIVLGSFKLTARGMLASKGATVEEWQQVGKVLSKLQGSLQWVIGDWVAYGEVKYGQTIADIAALFGYKEASIHQFAWVARNVHFSIRIEKLEFGHHMLVAGMEMQTQQQEWLQYAAAKGLSVAKMRALMKGDPDDKPLPLVDAKAAKVVKRVLSWDAGAISDEKARARMLKDIAAARATLDAVEKKVRGE